MLARVANFHTLRLGNCPQRVNTSRVAVRATVASTAGVASESGAEDPRHLLPRTFCRPLFSFLKISIVDFTYFCLFMTPLLQMLCNPFFVASSPLCVGYVFVSTLNNMLFELVWKSRTCFDRQKGVHQPGVDGCGKNVRVLHFWRESFQNGLIQKSKSLEGQKEGD